MKKLTIALLMTLAFNNAFVICADGETTSEAQTPTKETFTQRLLKTVDFEKRRLKLQATVKENPDLFKGLAGIGLAGFFGYLAYSCGTKIDTYNFDYDLTQKITEIPYILGPKKYIDSIQDIKPRRFWRNNLGLIINGLIASECAQYAIKKLSPIIAEKTPESVKSKLSAAYSAVSDKVQAKAKSLGSWIKSKIETKNVK